MKTMAWIAAVAAIAVAAPASAATFLMALDGGGTNVAGSGGGTSNGNVRTYSSTVSGQTLTLTATAWTNANSLSTPLIKSAYLGAYGGASYGLGVTAKPYEDGSSATHTVDNVGQVDFILLKFNFAVDLTSMYLNAFNISGAGADSDATVLYKHNATAPTDGLLSSSYFSQFTSIDVPGGSTGGARTVDVGGNYSNTWLVSANTGSADRDDGFKLYSITAITAVPEPTSWALMLVGFAGMGAVLRRRRAGFAAA